MSLELLEDLTGACGVGGDVRMIGALKSGTSSNETTGGQDYQHISTLWIVEGDSGLRFENGSGRRKVLIVNASLGVSQSFTLPRPQTMVICEFPALRFTLSSGLLASDL